MKSFGASMAHRSGDVEPLRSTTFARTRLGYRLRTGLVAGDGFGSTVATYARVPAR
jgi:hypothetical protein